MLNQIYRCYFFNNDNLDPGRIILIRFKSGFRNWILFYLKLKNLF